MIWQDWADGVLAGVGAPTSATNLATLNAWSLAESGADVMRWNNPLNTTQPMPGAVDMNSVGVKKYRTWLDGLQATVITLQNGHYPDILACLRQSTPAPQWTPAARQQLDTWGTGSGWLNSVPGEPDMDAETLDKLKKLLDEWPNVRTVIGRIFYVLQITQPDDPALSKSNVLDELVGEIEAIKAQLPKLAGGGSISGSFTVSPPA